MSMFMHGGLAHISGNMLFLWIFGDNIENALGAFPLCCLLPRLRPDCLAGPRGSRPPPRDGNLLVPGLGASGAISGVLGGYGLLFPGRRVRMILFRSV